MKNLILILACLTGLNTQAAYLDLDFDALEECIGWAEGHCMVVGYDNTGCLEEEIKVCKEENIIIVPENIEE